MDLLFTIPQYRKKAPQMAEQLDLKFCQAKVARFLSGDFYVELKNKVKNKRCYIIGGTIEYELLETSLLAHTLKKEGAKEIIALIPYLGYARQDKNEKGKSLGVLWLGELLKASGIKKVYTLDLHSGTDKKLFPIPLISTNPYKILAQKIPENFRQASIVAPDFGATDNAEDLKKFLQNKQPILYLKKKREGQRIISQKIISSVGSRAIIVDDILDTGQTIINAAQELKKKGTREIIVVVTHALFSGEDWPKIWQSGVKKIYCSGSVGRRVKDSRVIYINWTLNFHGHLTTLGKKSA